MFQTQRPQVERARQAAEGRGGVELLTPPTHPHDHTSAYPFTYTRRGASLKAAVQASDIVQPLLLVSACAALLLAGPW